MCGISGSINRETAYKLYRDNLDRGFYSSGSLTLEDNGTHTCTKVLGQFKEPVDPQVDTAYYLYHSRGPTVETHGFVEDNNHPFFYKNWVVAHNGIISNFNKLWEKYGDGDITGKTDSCIIPRILSSTFSIGEALQELEGTFALWVYNKETKELYITRSGSTLFANRISGDFSSTEFQNSYVLDEGIVYRVYFNKNSQNKRIEETYTYKTNSPYFFL